MTDEQLTSLLKEGDHGAFTQIYERFKRKLLAMAYNYSRDKALAEEVVQEVFVSLWEKRQDVAIKSLEAYLATSIKFSVFRTLQRDLHRKELAAQHYSPAAITYDHEQVYARFLQEYIDGIVENLPEKCRLVFIYSRTDGLNNREIAQKMDIAEKTVEAHLSKAIKTIKNNLNDNDLLMVTAFGLPLL
ncbi:RNA polymerase sigma-70 factor, ECF subfamily [bacterium A37T11]|nr:RNA polymerase sigma-70 factor, ECF subfamily [bacterium A37T11]